MNITSEQDTAIHAATSAKAGKIMLVGIGPGSVDHMTHRARAAIAEADTVIGYVTYIKLVADLLEGKEVIRKGMTEELDRAVSALEAAGARGVGAGVGAFLHTKQFGLDQLGGQGGAVHRHERRVAPVRQLVQGARKAFLADAGLAGQQHRDLGLRHFLHQGVSLAKGGRRANQPAALADRLQR